MTHLSSFVFRLHAGSLLPVLGLTTVLGCGSSGSEDRGSCSGANCNAPVLNLPRTDDAEDASRAQQTSSEPAAPDATPAAQPRRPAAMTLQPGGAAGAAGASGAEGFVEPAPEIDLCIPSAEPDLPDEDFRDTNCDGIDGDVSRAVFVSQAGTLGAAGTMEDPLATLKAGLERAVESGRDVYVCVGSYVENVVIEQPGVHVYGGYDCDAGWARTHDRPIVAPATGVALRITNAPEVRIEQMAWVAADASEPGASSTAAVIENSPGLQLTRVTLEAGNGAPGEPGTPVLAVSEPPPRGADGESITILDCPVDQPAAGECTERAAGGLLLGGPLHALLQTCATSSNHGGRGGYGGNQWITGGALGAAGEAGSPNGASGGVRPLDGQVGADGPDGSDGSPAQAGLGSLVDGNYVATNHGTDGEPGSPGQPGGGGSGGDSVRPESGGFLADYFHLGSGGGQGGYGGCGGRGGLAGGAGGASIALLLIDSEVTLQSCSVRTADGGDGGAPSAGAAGQPGGMPGRGGALPASHSPEVRAALSGKDGGHGGSGGRGGAGGPGGGGPSVGILVLGTMPVVEDTTFELGQPGFGGRALVGPDAPAGETGDMLLLGAAISE